ncbi:MAG: hypothetical protein H6711_04080 [Myxococcales bacterium]|nr:hypothetical protein [Myxococcales bacterium]
MPTPSISVRSRHTPAAKLAAKAPDAAIVDLTSRGPEPWVRFSPFYPHGQIPVPFSPGRVGASVEGIWQGLKVFETADVDLEVMARTTMKSLKRTVRRHGRCLGHRRGIDGDTLLGYLDARRQIYLPTYAWVLEHRLADEVAALEALARAQPLILLDYETNCDVDDLRKPLSHAGLVAAHLRERLAAA